MLSPRIAILRGAIVFSFIALFCGLFYFQVLRFNYYKGLSLKNTIRLIPYEAPRGGIYDRNNAALAIDRISFELVIVPQETKDIDSTLSRLSKITNIDKEALRKNYRRNYNFPFAPVAVISNIPKQEAFLIEEKLSFVPGAFIFASPRRTYPNKNTASHAIGYVGRINKEELSALKEYGYKVQDVVGKSGIEKQCDAYLKGEDGGIQIEVDALSREVRRLGFRQPKKGKDVKLTIDLGLQNFVDALMQEHNGACIIMNSRTGAILAFSSAPSFDLNVFVSGTDKERAAILRDSRHALLNRAISSCYPPGSVFKIAVATGAMAGNAVNAHTSFVCDGTYRLGRAEFHCWKKEGHGPQDIVQGITHSCNIFFWNTGRLLGADKIYYYANCFGLGNLTGIDIQGEAKGIVPNPMWKRFFMKEQWYEGDTLNYSIGQGYLLVTPIQMLRFITITANEGYSPAPYLLEEIEGKKVSGKRPYVSRIRPEAFKYVREGLTNVVNDPTGTGQNAKVEGLLTAGKTGTAQSSIPGSSHAWFAGYLPADNPQISIIIFLEHGGQGGAAPAHFAKLIGTYLKDKEIVRN